MLRVSEPGSPEALRHEATTILHEGGLLAALARYGEPRPSGSYDLDLMVWRDLDVYVVTPDLPLSRFFSLGGEIAELLRPHRMRFRDERIAGTPGLPRLGLYWGVYFGQWKLDVWAVAPEEFERLDRYLESVRSRLNTDSRKTILRLKEAFFSHAEYRQSFSAKDIYDAVLDRGVTDEAGLIRSLARQGIAL
jgi:hypothetical protein